jgi:hypothetical protein
LPPKYYVDHWRKDVKQICTLIKYSFDALSANLEVEKYDNLCKGMHTLAKTTASMDHYTKVQTHIDMLIKELHGLNYEPSPEPRPPSLVLPNVSLTCNESIDNVDLTVDGDEVYSPIVAQIKGGLPHKRKMSTMEKAIVKKSQRKSK